ncbi:histidine phosphatase family protein [Streptomyces sp. NPDC021093]|uniref:histidine phosphatase family protein n=1 Tax=Streptomyces sp. NPDC021093 TaxID=3365112 RepID=UPI0037B8F7D1
MWAVPRAKHLSVENATKYTGFYARPRPRPRPWTGPADHALSRDIIGLTPRGFLQCLWLRDTLRDLTAPGPAIHTSQYRRAIDRHARPARHPLRNDGAPQRAALRRRHLHDQAGAVRHLPRGAVRHLPRGAEDRQTRKHLWTPPGPGGESLTEGVLGRATAFANGLPALPEVDVVAFTHHTTLLALRAVLERRPVTDLVDEARLHKTSNAAFRIYEQAATGGLFHARGALRPDC